MDHNEYWRTKNGRAIAIKDMPTGHLRNAIAMLRRNTPSREAPEFYWEELKVGYSAMVEELERRKLEESVRSKSTEPSSLDAIRRVSQAALRGGGPDA